MANEYSLTMALCGKCGRKVRAAITGRAGKVYLRKFCPEHGESEVMLAADEKWYEESRSYVKQGQSPLAHAADYSGCPESCGFCGEHQQHTCLPIIEITDRCDMNCPVCLKDFARPFSFSQKDFETAVGAVIRTEGACPVLNISGGEPTAHPLLEGFFRAAVRLGVTQITVSTNGLRLLADPKMRALFRRYGAIAALQFDGPSPRAAKVLRGDSQLAAKKNRLIGLMEAEGNRYSLVCTVAKGVNDGDIPEITDSFFRSKALSLMFQPVTLTGRGSGIGPGCRITTDEVVGLIGKSGFARREDFNPLPCSHYSCFALAYYFSAGKEKFLSLKDIMGREFYINAITNKTLPGLGKSEFAEIKARLYELWSAADSSKTGDAVLHRIRAILREIEREGFSPRKALDAGMEAMKAIFIHSFMDRETMDMSRLIKCCNPYVLADGRLIPMCAQNVFRQGRPGRPGSGIKKRRQP